MDQAARAVLHTEVRTQIAADGRGKGGVLQRQIHGFLQVALADQFPSFLNGNAGRAGRLAGRRIFSVFPGRDVTPQHTGGNHVDRRAVQTRQIADQPSCAQFIFPDLPAKFCHRANGPRRFFGRFSGDQKLPVFAFFRELLKQILLADGLQKCFEVLLQPLPLKVRKVGHQAGILRAVGFLLSAEEYFAADHADAGPVSQHVSFFFRARAADHGDAARHEFRERIRHFAEDPEFGWFKARVEFGHGHAARADVAADVNPALSHGVCRSVGGISVHDDLRACVEPADVVGGRAEDFNRGVRESHGSQALAGCAQDIHFYRRVLRAPEAASDAVLPQRRDFNVTAAVGHGLLHAFFQNPRIHANLVFNAGDFDGVFFGHHLACLIPSLGERLEPPCGRQAVPYKTY